MSRISDDYYSIFVEELTPKFEIMKYLKTILPLSVVFLLVTSCNKTAQKLPETITKTESNTLAKMQTASFTINGMTCAEGCARTIEEKLSKTEGVQTATVDFETKKAKIEFDSNKQTLESLSKIVEAVGDGETYKVVQ